MNLINTSEIDKELTESKSIIYFSAEKSLEENISITRKVVELAKKYDANVEAELRYIAKLGQSKEKLTLQKLMRLNFLCRKQV